MRKKVLFASLVAMALIFSVKAYANSNVNLSITIQSNVHNITKGIWYDCITNAIADTSNNCIIEVFSGVYQEHVRIANFSNLTIRGRSWSLGGAVTNTYLSEVPGSPYNIKITNARGITIQGLMFRNASNGLLIVDASSNHINQNIFYSNKVLGIFSRSGISVAQNNYAVSNTCLYNGLFPNLNGPSSAIFFSGTRFDKILNNICKFGGIGIWISGNDETINNNSFISNAQAGMGGGGPGSPGLSTNNVFTGNTASWNSGFGAYFMNFSKNSLINNNFNNNLLMGIGLTNSPKSVVKNNNIFNNGSIGLQMYASSNSMISNNALKGNTLKGIYVVAGLKSKILKNSVSFSSNGVWMTNVSQMTLANNTIATNPSHGISLVGTSTYNRFNANTIFSNLLAGITLDGDNVDNNLLDGNIVRKNGSGQPFAGGIIINNGDSNVIVNNPVVALNNTIGIGLAGSAQYNIVKNNISYSNNSTSGLACGVMVGVTPFAPGSTRYNTIVSNRLFGNRTGVLCAGGQNNNVLYNSITNNFWGICAGISSAGDFASTNLLIQGNRVLHNATNGLLVTSGSSVTDRLNTFQSNMVGVKYVTGSMVCTKNNFLNNLVFNIVMSNSTPITNNWFGSTKTSNIRLTISNYAANSTFTPYRLFGQFDIRIGADSDRLPSITWATAYNGSSYVRVQWSKPSNTADFFRYFVYRSTKPGYTNLTIADRVWQTNNVNGTNFYDAPSQGTYYYYITALDTAPTYTNEAWYSVQASGTMGLIAIVIQNTNLFYNTRLNRLSSSNMSVISNAGSLQCQVIGQVNDFTNVATPSFVWHVTNNTTFNKIIVEYKVDSGVWTQLINQQTSFVISPAMLVGDKKYLYIRFRSPIASYGVGIYKSRLRASAMP